MKNSEFCNHEYKLMLLPQLNVRTSPEWSGRVETTHGTAQGKWISHFTFSR